MSHGDIGVRAIQAEGTANADLEVGCAQSSMLF